MSINKNPTVIEAIQGEVILPTLSKSDIVRRVAAKMEIQIIDIRLSQLAPDITIDALRDTLGLGSSNR